MDWSTDPKMLEGRVFYKLGESIFDHKKKVLVIGILTCMLLGSLISMGPNWAESWGEGDLESIEAGDLRKSAFASEDEGNQSEHFILLINHPTLDDSSQVWQQAVISALAEFHAMDDVTIQYSWETSGEQRNKFVYQDENGLWAKNKVKMSVERKAAIEIYDANWEDIEVDSEFDYWRTGDLAVDVIFDSRIQDDLIKAALIS